ncbi:MAG TPA: RNA-binding cell elongation regulator Jag/EloR [Bacillota bacterium]|nr:RNA-binding cell elongation regulator Jag/EloR [Bacillota bacterium]
MVEKTAKTVEEAVDLALVALGITAEQAEIEVLEEASKGLFGLFGGKQARVRVTATKTAEQTTLEFIEGLCDRMGAGTVSCTIPESDGESVTFNIVGANTGLLIGKRGLTLDAIQQLTTMVFLRSGGGHRRVIVDVNSYRARRIESLQALAVRLAEKAKRTGRRVIMEPMGAFERRVVHMALQNDPEVSTFSEGEEPFRKVIISAK